MDKEDEMECLIKGCNFLLKNIPDEAFIFQRRGNPDYHFQSSEADAIFPYLLVNIGSGVSILKVCRALSAQHVKPRPPLNKKLFPVYRPGGSKRADWNFLFHI